MQDFTGLAALLHSERLNFSVQPRKCLPNTSFPIRNLCKIVLNSREIWDISTSPRYHCYPCLTLARIFRSYDLQDLINISANIANIKLFYKNVG